MSDESSQHEPQQSLGEAGSQEERETRSPQEAPGTPDRPGQFKSPLAVDPLGLAAEGTASIRDGRATLGRKDASPVKLHLRKLRRGMVGFRKAVRELIDGSGRDFMLAPSELAEVEALVEKLAQAVKDARSALDRDTTQDGMATGSGRSSHKEAEGDDGQAGK